MGVILARKKRRNWLVTLLYRVSRLIPAGSRFRLSLFLDLEWIFERLALEESFRVFDRQVHPVRTTCLQFLERHLRPTDRVLDLGCKHGELSALMAPLCREVIGIDLDGAALATARGRSRADNVTFTQGDGVAYLRDQAGRFEVLIASHVIEHLDDPRPLLETAARSCRSVYIEVPDFDRSFSNAFRRLLRSELIYSDADHVWEFDRRELQALVAGCGLSVRDQEASHGVLRMWCNPT